MSITSNKFLVVTTGVLAGITATLGVQKANDTVPIDFNVTACKASAFDNKPLVEVQLRGTSRHGEASADLVTVLPNGIQTSLMTDVTAMDIKEVLSEADNVCSTALHKAASKIKKQPGKTYITGSVQYSTAEVVTALGRQMSRKPGFQL